MSDKVTAVKGINTSYVIFESQLILIKHGLVMQPEVFPAVILNLGLLYFALSLCVLVGFLWFLLSPLSFTNCW